MEWNVPRSAPACRLDLYIIKRGVPLSRTRIQSLIDENRVQVNGKQAKAGYKIRPGDKISISVPSPRAIMIQPEPIPIEILYQDEDLLIVNKAAGIVMHPAPGNYTGTLVHALLHHVKDLKGIGGEERPGIVHRLDKETSGVAVVAKSEHAMVALMRQFKAHTVKKSYLTLVWGKVKSASGKVDLRIGRDRRDRKKISSHSFKLKEALSHYQVLRRFRWKESKEFLATLVEVRPETGRTHQIRVHMASIGHPVIGDKTYGGNEDRESGLQAERQMLHASTLSFKHPRTGALLSFTAPVPPDMKQLVDTLTALQEASRDATKDGA